MKILKFIKGLGGFTLYLIKLWFWSVKVFWTSEDLKWTSNTNIGSFDLSGN